MNKLILIALLSFLSFQASAASVIVGGLSYHTFETFREGPLTKKINNTNPLIAFEVDGWIIGKMKNSYHEKSTFVAKNVWLVEKQYLKFGVMGMLANKYTQLQDPNQKSQTIRFGSLQPMAYFTFESAKIFDSPVSLLVLAIPTSAYVLTAKIDF